MTRPAALLALLLAVSGCDCEPARRPDTPGDGSPGAELVEKMPDPYANVPARGALDPVERTARILAEAGRPFGWGEQAAQGFRAHKDEAWVKRVALLVDFGGTEQLHAAWLDLEDSLVSSARISPEMKLKLRQAEARVDEDQNEGVAEDVLRRRLLAEVAWVFVPMGEPRDGGAH